MTRTGRIETFASETGAGWALHLLNYTNPAAFRGNIREFYPIGPQQVSMAVPRGRHVTRVELLCAEKDVPFRQAGPPDGDFVHYLALGINGHP